MPKPLVSILIPAYNAQEWLAETLQSAVNQTWSRKEVILVDDGSTDRTADIARSFVPKITFVSTENRGLSAALNLALQLSRGDYIQELDADDLLLPDKIERQLAALREGDSRRILLSSPWAPFYYRTRRARFISTSLCQDLSPVEWMLRKMSENLHMQNATWLVSRELVEAAGPWDEALHYDQDGEYFARVLFASERTRFVPGTGIFYRASPSNRVSYIGNSVKKKESLLRAMQLQMQYLRSFENSERVRNACLTYMQNWYINFYPEPPHLVDALQTMAAELHGRLEEPTLSWKYAWIKRVIGWKGAKRSQAAVGLFTEACFRRCDKAIYKLQTRSASEAAMT